MVSVPEHPHRRFNPLLGEWVLVSPHRNQRPWQGLVEEAGGDALPEYDPSCYLCPGNNRANGDQNPDYTGTFVFNNDYPALLLEAPPHSETPDHDLLRAEPETGRCRVVCYSPRHDLSLARLDVPAMAGVVDAWCDEYLELGKGPDIGYVQIFENRGALMGCSNPHPHGQIWANKTVPDIPRREGLHLADHLEKKGRCLLCRYLELELSRGERVVLENDSFVALVPYWAVWPYEVMILPREHLGSITDMSGRQRQDLAEVMIRQAVRYDNLFLTPFPYSMGIHQKPTDTAQHPEWHFHLHFYPPLLRSSTVRKFMVGYELMAMPQRDTPAEQSAAALAGLADIHYLDRGDRP